MFVDPVAHHAARTPEATAVILDHRLISYGLLDTIVGRLAAGLSRTVEPRSRVALLMTDFYAQWLLILALMRLGATSMTVDPARQDVLLPLHDPAVVLTEKPTTAPHRGIETLVTTDWLKATADNAQPMTHWPRVAPNDLARIVASSGTTGRPKQIGITYSNLSLRLASSSSAAQPANPRALSLFGLDTIGGIIPTLRTWLFGGAVVMTPVTPDRLIRHGVQTLSASVAQLRSLIAALPSDFVPQPGLIVSVGGSTLPRELGQAASGRLTPQLTTAYGSTEANAVAACPFQLTLQMPDLTGVIRAFADVEAVDDNDRPLASGEVGIIRLRTPEMVGGYIDDPEATARAFRGGWFYPGDLGSVTDGRFLRIVGRIDEVVNVGGVKLAPDLVDQELVGLPGIADAAAFGVTRETGGEELWIAVVSLPDFDPARIREALRRLGGDELVRIMRVAAIPRAASGKVQRYRLKQLSREALAKGPDETF